MRKGTRLSVETRTRMSVAKRGEKHPSAKLTDAQAYEIWQQLQNPSWGLNRELARKYGVTEGTISNIKHKRRFVSPPTGENIKLKRSFSNVTPKDDEELWEIHKNLAYSAVMKMHKQFPEVLELDEKLSYAWMAMVKARKRYDPKKNVKFFTYAYGAVMNEVRRAIDKELTQMHPGPVRAPGEYDVTLIHTDYQEEPNEDSSRNMTPQLYKSEAFYKPQAEDIADLKMRLEKLKECLSEKYQRAVDFMVNDGYNGSQAAKAIGVSREALRVMLEKGVRKSGGNS